MGGATNSAGREVSPGWVVVHDAARDHYQLPIALAEEEMLARFVTDWYTPLDRPFWSRIAQSSVFQSTFGLRSRFRPQLDSRLVTDQKFRFLAGLAWRKLWHEPFRDEKDGAKAGRLAAKIANARNAPLLATSYSGASAFAYLREDLPRVLFQVHPHPRSLRNLYAGLMARDRDYGGLESEPEASASEQELQQWETESAAADFVLCASEFSRKSLLEGGIGAERIAVLPYGVNSDLFPFGRPEKTAPFTALFVGQKVARKSVRTLVRAWRELGLKNARLILAGGHVRDVGILSDLNDGYEEVERISLHELILLYQQADVFILPSVAEGFGHVYLEALSCGTPILCTENTGGADVIREGESGWIVPAGDREALRDRLAWCVAHRSTLRAMREPARAVAERHTWERFRAGIRTQLRALEQTLPQRARPAGVVKEPAQAGARIPIRTAEGR